MANLITLPEDWEERSPQKKVFYLHSLASSMNEALDLIQKERNALAEENARLVKSVESGDQQNQQLKTLMTRQILAANEETQAANAETLRLQDKIREYKNIIRKYENGGND